MKTIILGDSGAEVSELCLGALPFGTKVSEQDSFSLLDHYFEAGGRFIDTANNYSMWHPGGKGGESETAIGKWMKDRGNRSDVFIATKVGFNTADVGRSLSKSVIESEIEGSLEKLGVDYVDLYYAHGDIRKDSLEETLEAFDKIVKTGKARFIGCSNHRAWRIEKARGISQSNNWASYCCVQQRFTYLRPRPAVSFDPQVSANEDLLDFCSETPGVRMLAFTPLLGGSYDRPDKSIPDQYQTVETEERLKRLAKVASECGATIHQTIYAWMIQRTPCIIPLSAPTTLEQLKDNLCCLSVTLSEDQIKTLDEAV